MTSIFDPFSALDPERSRKQIVAAKPTVAFDQFSALDPARQRAQEEAGISGLTLDQYAALDAQRERDEIDAAIGGGGGGYKAKAVHFDGSSFLSNAGPIAADSSFITVSGFIRVPVAPPSGAGNFYYLLFDLNPANSEWGLTTRADGLLNFSFGTDDQSSYFNPSSSTGVFPFDIDYHSMLMSVDLNHAAGSRLAALYLDDVLVPLTVGLDLGIAFQQGFDYPIGVPDTTDDEPQLLIGDLAVVQIRPGLSIVQGDNTINVADRRNFVSASNKPINPATATAAYGVPAVLLDGDHTGFVTNQGTGGAFALTGTLTNASTSPSD